MLNPDFREMLSALNDAGVEYLLVRAYAMAVHGVPRATGDLDFWVRRERRNAERLIEAPRVFGAPTEGVEVRDFLEQDVVFQVGRQPSRIDFLTSIDGVEFQEAWAERVDTEVDGVRVQVLGRDDLIRNKRAVGRPRDLADIEELE